jgi:hypothetical protein
MVEGICVGYVVEDIAAWGHASLGEALPEHCVPDSPAKVF